MSAEHPAAHTSRRYHVPAAEMYDEPFPEWRTVEVVRVSDLGVVDSDLRGNRPGDATNAPGHDTEEVPSMPDKLYKLRVEGIEDGTRRSYDKPFDETYEIEAEHVAEALTKLVGGQIEWGILDADREFTITYVPESVACA